MTSFTPSAWPKTALAIENDVAGYVDTRIPQASSSGLYPISNASGDITWSIPIDRQGISQVDCFGHSYLADPGGIGYMYPDRLSRSLGARRRSNRGWAGAVACHPGTVGSLGEGNFGWVLQEAMRPGSPINALKPAHPESAAAPYLPREQISLDHYGLNDLAVLGSQNPRPFKEALRTIWSRRCAAALWEDDAAAWVFTGTWSTIAQTHANSGPQIKSTTTVNDKATFTIPSDYPAGYVIAIGLFVDASLGSSTIGVKVNGVAQADAVLDPTVVCAQSFVNTPLVVTLRFDPSYGGSARSPLDYPVSLAASQTIELTLKSGAKLAIDFAQIEADPLDGPILLVCGTNRTPNYDTAWGGTKQHGSQNSRNGTTSNGSNIITAIATPTSGISGTADLKVGMPVSGTSIPGSTTITSIDSTTQIHISNNAGVGAGTVALTFDPMSDASVPYWNTAIQATGLEFQNRFVFVDIDTPLAKDTKNFISDNAHPNTKGQGLIVDAVRSALLNSQLLTQRVLSRPAMEPVFFEPVGMSGRVSTSNSWVLAGSAYPQLGYHRTLENDLYIRGAVKKSTGAATDVVFNLPIGHRPATGATWPQFGINASVLWQPLLCQAVASGDVSFVGSMATGTGGSISNFPQTLTGYIRAEA